MGKGWERDGRGMEGDGWLRGWLRAMVAAGCGRAAARAGFVGGRRVTFVWRSFHSCSTTFHVHTQRFFTKTSCRPAIVLCWRKMCFSSSTSCRHAAIIRICSRHATLANEWRMIPRWRFAVATKSIQALSDKLSNWLAMRWMTPWSTCQIRAGRGVGPCATWRRAGRLADLPY